MASPIEVEMACGERRNKRVSEWVSEQMNEQSLFGMNNMETMTLASTRAVRLNKFQIREYYILLCKRWHTNGKQKNIRFFWILSRGDVWTRSIPSTYAHNCTCIFMVTTHRYELVRIVIFFVLFSSSNMEVFVKIALKRKNERFGMNGQHHTLYYFYSTIFGCYSFTSDLLGYVTFTTRKKRNQYCTPSHN